jgi:glycosyltransferase involved in cell wall biosynthesis
MAKRRKIGIIFRNYSHWTGGVNYIINLINSINTLNDIEKPGLVIYTFSKEDYRLIVNTGYPYLSYKNINVYAGNKYVHYFNRVTRKITGRNWLVKYFSPTHVTFIFPQSSEEIFRKFENCVGWIPDFQEYYYPEFFTPEEVVARNAEHQRIANKSKVIVFSSEDAQKDFLKFYPGSSLKKKVVNFSVSDYDMVTLNRNELETKYNLFGKYFISPNQFWIHKNHKIVIEAINILKKEGKEILVIFTGKEEDYRSPDYANELKKLVAEKNLCDNIRFLGFIDKADLIGLIKNSIAVIQPSLFEGWSTVIEDAKALNKFVIASAINVHKEQLKRNVVFFDKSDPGQLAEYLKYYFDSAPIIEPIDYSTSIRRFGESFVDILREFES